MIRFAQSSPPGTAAGHRPDAGRRARPDIQGLRAVAVLMVLLFHSGLPVPGGFIGVDVFFVISGFVITAMLQREWAVSGRIQLGRFYLRRFKRLAPALAVMLAVTTVASALVLSPFGTQQVAAWTAIGAVLLAANAVIAKMTGGYFDPAAENNPLLNVWSLSVEEQFYLAFPSIIAAGWLLARKSRSLRFAPLLIVACAAAVSLATAVIGSHLLRTPSWIGFYSPASRAWEFAAGAFLAMTVGRGPGVAAGGALAMGLAGALLLGASLWLITPATPFPGAWTLLPVAGSMFLILAGTNESNAVSRSLAAPPLVKVGDWSYSLYLWHWPFAAFAGILWPETPLAVLIAVALSFAPAIISYLWVEQPLRTAQGLSRPQCVLLVGATVVPPLLFGAGLWQLARTFFGQESSASLATKMTLPTGWENPWCISRIPVNERDVQPCRWGGDALRAPIYLVGDSTAMHFSDAVRKAGRALRRPLTALGANGCPLIDVFLRRKSEPLLMPQCRADYTAMMDWLAGSPPGLVMIGAADRYWRDWRDYRASIDRAAADFDAELHAEALNEGLRRTVVTLQRAGHSVLLLQAIPAYTTRPHAYGASVCSGWDVIAGSCRLVAKMPVAAADDLQRASREGIARVAATTGAAVLDLRPYFCRGGTCSTRVDGIDMYMPDGYHLNKLGSTQLTEIFIETLASLAEARPAGAHASTR